MSTVIQNPRQSVSNRTVFSSLDRATQAFRACLDAKGYNAEASREACFAIREYQETATLVELGFIDSEDQAELEAAFVGGFDAVHPSSPRWNDSARYATEPAPISEDLENWLEQAMWGALVDASSLPDVSEQEAAELGICRRF